MKILIVDDHEESRTYLRYLLQSHDCIVVEASDGLEGIEMALAHSPDMIISDSLMPKMDGFQMLMEIMRNEMTRDIPFLFYSGNYIGEQDADLAHSLGAYAYLLKPMQPEELWHEVQKIRRMVIQEKEERPDGKAADEHLRLYGKVVASKLDQKVQELEEEISRRKVVEDRLQSLSRSLLERVELERRHIARELHDDVGQTLTAVKMNMQAVLKMTKNRTLAGIVLDNVSGIERAIQSVRNLSLNLRPSLLDDLGLEAALRWLLDRTAGSAGIEASISVSGVEERLPSEIETACFRIAQETLNNIVKHAGASRIALDLRKGESTIELSIGDNGISFDVRAAFIRAVRGESFGLLGMQERALLAGGRFDIESSPDKGTLLKATFPIDT